MNFKIVRNQCGELAMVLTRKQAEHVDQLRVIFNVKRVTKNIVGQTLVFLNEPEDKKVTMIE